MAIENEIKRALETGKVKLGSDTTIKLLANKACKAVIFSKDAPELIKLDILNLSKLSGIPAYELPMTSKELGITCGKPFTVASLAIIDPGFSKILEELEKMKSEEK